MHPEDEHGDQGADDRIGSQSGGHRFAHLPRQGILLLVSVRLALRLLRFVVCLLRVAVFFAGDELENPAEQSRRVRGRPAQVVAQRDEEGAVGREEDVLRAGRFLEARVRRPEQEPDEQTRARRRVDGRRQARRRRAAEHVDVDLFERVDGERGDLRQQAHAENDGEQEDDEEEQVPGGGQLLGTGPLDPVEDGNGPRSRAGVRVGDEQGRDERYEVDRPTERHETVEAVRGRGGVRLDAFEHRVLTAGAD